jgi:hypothetical protein
MTKNAPSDPIGRLATAGLLNAARPLAEARRRVLAALSPEEVDTLVRYRQRIGAADAPGDSPDTTGTKTDFAVFALF